MRKSMKYRICTNINQIGFFSSESLYVHPLWLLSSFDCFIVPIIGFYVIPVSNIEWTVKFAHLLQRMLTETTPVACCSNYNLTCHMQWDGWVYMLVAVAAPLCFTSNILTPYWFKIIWDDTASKIHLTRVTYVTCTSDWQQNLTYAWYVTSSTQKSTLHLRCAPPTFIDYKVKRALLVTVSVYK